LDAAITDLKKIVDPANRDPATKRDFTRDVVVLNRLANIQFKKAIGETEASQRAILLEAIANSERALAIDSEDIAAHDRLKQAYSIIGRKPRYDGPPPEANANALNELLQTLTNGANDKASRVEAAGKLSKGLAEFVRVPGDVYPPRLPAIRANIVQLRAAFYAEKDAEMQAIVAAVLSDYHKASHDIYKVDEIARSHATSQFRNKPGNAPANYAGQERIIYPTTAAHRALILRTSTLTP
jgi:hypothetical protein